MIRSVLFFTFLLSLPLFSFSQDTDDQAMPEFQETQEQAEDLNKFDWNKVTIEPNFAFAISSGTIILGLAPYVGYEIFPKFFAGPGIVYYLERYKDVLPNVNVKQHTLGGGIFGQYFVYEQLFVRAKFEFLNRKTLFDFDPNNNPIYRKTNVPVLLLGAGYNMGFGTRIQFPIMVAYDVVQDDDSPYFTSGNFPLYIQIGFVSYF